MTNTEDFFADLPAIVDAQATFTLTQYQPAPDDWAVVVTDIVDSTGLIAAGKHKTVNFIAAMAITALKNLCAPTLIPFLFGGDGSVVMVPASQVDASRQALARVRNKVSREFNVDLRVSLVPVHAIRHYGADILVARYEPTAGNNFGVFAGGGVELLESAMRGNGPAPLANLSAIEPELDNNLSIDLSGLSCRWEELQSRHGKMVSIIISAINDAESIYTRVQQIAGENENPNPVRLDTLTITWPPTGLLLEARAQRGTGYLLPTLIKLIADTLIARIIFAIGRPVRGFDPMRYRHEIVTNTDFCKFDQTLCFVLDCPVDRIEQIRHFLTDQAEQNQIKFGLHVSDTALMTCLVTSPSDNLHVHFVDGGSGGYTEAAKIMKSAGVP